MRRFKETLEKAKEREKTTKEDNDAVVEQAREAQRGAEAECALLAA